MTRAAAQEALTQALKVAVEAGCSNQDIQDAIEHGFHDAGRLRQAYNVGERGVLDQSVLDAHRAQRRGL